MMTTMLNCELSHLWRFIEFLFFVLLWYGSDWLIPHFLDDSDLDTFDDAKISFPMRSVYSSTLCEGRVREVSRISSCIYKACCPTSMS